MILKHLLAMLVLSILVISFPTHFHESLEHIVKLYQWLMNSMNSIFAADGFGQTIKSTLSLYLIPVLITAIPSLGFYATQRRTMPHYLAFTWIAWFIVAITLICFYARG